MKFTMQHKLTAFSGHSLTVSLKLTTLGHASKINSNHLLNLFIYMNKITPSNTAVLHLFRLSLVPVFPFFFFMFFLYFLSSEVEGLEETQESEEGSVENDSDLDSEDPQKSTCDADASGD